jgi:hypothetical protein
LRSILQRAIITNKTNQSIVFISGDNYYVDYVLPFHISFRARNHIRAPHARRSESQRIAI